MSVPRAGLTLFASFSAAVFLCVYQLPVGLWLWLGLGALIPAGLFLWRRRRAGALICLGAAAALLWCGCFRAVFFAPAEALDGRHSRVTAVVSEEPTATQYGTMVSCWVVQEGAVPVKGTLYADDTALELLPGDRVTAVCNCDQTALQPETRLTAQASRGVFLRLEAQGPLKVERPQRAPWWCLPRWWGQKLAKSIQTVFPDDVAGMLTALVTGDKAGMTTAERTDLARTGAAHLTAVSGMHICFLVSLLTLFTGYDPRRRLAVCVPALILFALAVGATPSVLRACLFQFSFLLSELLGREEECWTTLFGALALLLLLDPFSVANISLQMSFAAVAGIGLVTPRVYGRLSRFYLPAAWRGAGRINFLLGRVWQLLSATLGAIAFTVPLSAWYFGEFSLLAPLTNLLILPVVSALFAATLLTGLLGLAFPAAAAAVAWVVAWPGRYVLWVVGALARLPFCSVTLEGDYYPAAFVVLCLLALIALCWRSQRRRSWVFALCGGAVFLGAALMSRWSLRAGTLTAAVLDVGQGQSVVLASQGETALLDCGGDNSWDDPGDVCADYLGDRGERVVDKLILTHYHADHVNGLDALFRRLDVREVVLPRMERDEETQLHILSLAQAEGARVVWVEEDTVLTLGDATLHIFAPLGGGEENEEGLSLLVRAGDVGMLMTGDMSEAVEQSLVARGKLGRCQVLVAGHHGSATATGETLLGAIRPETAVISVGENVYGHPAEETLTRLAQAGAEVYRTDQEGTVTIQVK